MQRSDLPWLAGAVSARRDCGANPFDVQPAPFSATTAALLLNFESVATTLIAGLIFHEAVGRRTGWAVGLITLASILLSWENNGQWGLA